MKCIGDIIDHLNNIFFEKLGIYFEKVKNVKFILYLKITIKLKNEIFYQHKAPLINYQSYINSFARAGVHLTSVELIELSMKEQKNMPSVTKILKTKVLLTKTIIICSICFVFQFKAIENDLICKIYQKKSAKN